MLKHMIYYVASNKSLIVITACKQTGSSFGTNLQATTIV